MKEGWEIREKRTVVYMNKERLENKREKDRVPNKNEERVENKRKNDSHKYE